MLCSEGKGREGSKLTAASAEGVRLGVALAKGRGSLCCCVRQLSGASSAFVPSLRLGGSWDFDGGFTYSLWAKVSAISTLASME